MPDSRKKRYSELASTRKVKTSISFVPSVTPFRFFPAMADLLYQTWLRIAAATTEKIITPAITSAAMRVALFFLSCFCVLIFSASRINVRIIPLYTPAGKFLPVQKNGEPAFHRLSRGIFRL